MFFVEIIAGFAAGSVSLQAGALDFLADAANYEISLFVVGMAVLLAALGVFGTGTGWPDVVVAAVMASLAL